MFGVMHLFAYGSLLLPEVMQAVTGRVFRFQGATLRGYAEFRLRAAPQAAIIPFPDMATQGVVYYDVDAASVRRLDAFGGGIYERVEVNAEAEDGEWVEAEAYVIHLKQLKLLTAKPWDEDEFRRKHLRQVVQDAEEARRQAPKP